MPRATRKEVESLLATILKQLVPRSDEKLVDYQRRIVRQLQSKCSFRKEWTSRNWFKERIRTAFDASVIFVLWQPRNLVEWNVNDDLIRSAFDAFLILWWLCAIKQHLSNSDVSVSLERVTLIYFRKVFPSSFHLTSLIRSGTRNFDIFSKGVPVFVSPDQFDLTNLNFELLQCKSMPQTKLFSKSKL